MKLPHRLVRQFFVWWGVAEWYYLAGIRHRMVICWSCAQKIAHNFFEKIRKLGIDYQNLLSIPNRNRYSVLK